MSSYSIIHLTPNKNIKRRFLDVHFRDVRFSLIFVLWVNWFMNFHWLLSCVGMGVIKAYFVNDPK